MRALYKILHTTCHTEWGGLEKRIFNESVWMEGQGHKIVVVAPKDSPLFQKAKEHGFKVYGVDFKRLSMAKDYRFLRHIFSNEKPDIVNTHGNKDSKLALYAAKKEDVPLRILSRHISAHVRNSWYNRIIYKKLCHYIFTTAGYTTRHLRAVFKLTNMQVFSMPSGIILPETLPDRSEARQRLAEELGLTPDTRFIGFVGRVSSDKGVSTLIEAFEKIAPTLPDHRLVIMGEGPEPYLRSLETLAAKLGISDRIHFTGFREEVWPYYRAFDCKVLPSRNINRIPFEGVPQALLEAMASECPVIGSDTGGIADIIEHGNTGLLFDPEDVSALSDCILQTLQDQDTAAKRVETARDFVKKHHTIDAMGRNIVRIYRLHQVRLDRRVF